MVQLTEEQLKEIAGALDTGMTCCIHRQTGELIAFPDPDRFADFELEGWQNELDKVAAEPEAYFEITPMSSRESFQIMELFVEKVVTGPLQDRLLRLLSQSKPFRRFKDEIDNSEVYRQRWFAFREQQTSEWLREQLSEADY